MGNARYIVGDVFDRMAELPDGSVDLVHTSPPFYCLRSYLPADHPDKAKEIGSEPTPAAFLDTLLALTAEWRRLLAPHGSICVELGDTYSGSNEAGWERDKGEYRREARSAAGAAGKLHGARGSVGWPLDKSLCGIPHLYHLSLAYGRNLLTGEASPAGQWRVRNVVAWVRPNPPVGALGDKFRPATSYLTVACVGRSRYFDLDAVRVPYDGREPPARRQNEALSKSPTKGNTWDGQKMMQSNPAGAPPLDWWEIPTHPYPGSHYATWPPALCTRPILAMSPPKVCRECGKASERIVEHERTFDKVGPSAGRSEARNPNAGPMGAEYEVTRTTLGWSDCGCSDDGSHWRPGLVLDPFAGSGTTLAVATGHGRDAIGIDLDPRNADLARERVGLFLEVEDAPRPLVDVPPSEEVA